MRILLTNDDGIDAPGLISLYKAVQDMGDIIVVAPATVQSASSHAVTFHKPLRVDKREYPDFTGYAVHGRPADCVKLAIEELVKDPIDLVISGMNYGANIGINVIYSGTVAAAREAAFLGIPAIAASLHVGTDFDIDINDLNWTKATNHARTAIDAVMAGPINPHTVVNLNVPRLADDEEPQGMKVVPISRTHMVNSYDVQVTEEGHTTYKISTGMDFAQIEANTDVEALFNQYITLTPLHYDLTHEGQLKEWQKHIQVASKPPSSGVG
ncbi:5'/3'-nucleotidase SurE [Planctomycetota bacterium]|nr:5'/3'-nucleotidase SurE [Planctomycetota bacterium]